MKKRRGQWWFLSYVEESGVPVNSFIWNVHPLVFAIKKKPKVTVLFYKRITRRELRRYRIKKVYDANNGRD